VVWGGYAHLRSRKTRSKLRLAVVIFPTPEVADVAGDHALQTKGKAPSEALFEAIEIVFKTLCAGPRGGPPGSMALKSGIT